MDSGVEPTAVARATDLLDRMEWRRALDVLRKADAFDNGTPEQLELLARAAYGAGDYEGAVSAWEAIHAKELGAGRDLPAANAAVMVAMYLMMDSGLLAPVRGWLDRADRLLEGSQDTPVHAMSAMVRMYERLMTGNLDQVEPLAHEAITIGERHGVVSATTLGRVGLARFRVLEGRIDEGLSMLDEVAVFLMSGGADRLTAGMVWCELICAMLGLGEYDRAAEWTAAFDRPRRDGRFFGGINGRCRVHRAEMLRHRGSCAEAEDEALHACNELRPWMRREFGWPLTELGTIRLRRGDHPGAEEAFRAAQVNGWDPQPGLALLRLEQGDPAAASAMIEEALAHPRRIPSKERPPNLRLSRAPLLEARVRIAVAVHDPGTARAAATELSEVADFYGSPGLVAAASLARARAALAARDVESALSEGNRAVDRWAAVGLPWETAMARLTLASAHRAAGRHDAAQVEEQTATTVLEEIGAAVPSTIPDSAAPQAPTPDRSDPSVATFCRKGDMRVVDFEGTQVFLGDLKGMRYLERLLEEPGREFHVLDLVAVEHGTLPTAGKTARSDDLSLASDGAGPMLDETARSAYKRRLAEIEEDIAEAEAMGDSARVELAVAERDFLVSELSRAFDIDGRQRSAVSNSERARSSVTRTIRYSLDRLAEEHRPLGRHLESTVSTGTYCCYAPDPRLPIRWQV